MAKVLILALVISVEKSTELSFHYIKILDLIFKTIFKYNLEKGYLKNGYKDGNN